MLHLIKSVVVIFFYQKTYHFLYICTKNINTVNYICRSIAEMRVNRDKQHRVYIYLPAFLRDNFDFQNEDRAEVDTNGNQII